MKASWGVRKWWLPLVSCRARHFVPFLWREAEDDAVLVLFLRVLSSQVLKQAATSRTSGTRGAVVRRLGDDAGCTHSALVASFLPLWNQHHLTKME